MIFVLSGFAALIYEVSWNRQLGLLFGHMPHAAAVVLAAYFSGIAIGYAVGGHIANRICPYRGYTACELITAARALAIPFGVDQCATSSFSVHHSKAMWNPKASQATGGCSIGQIIAKA